MWTTDEAVESDEDLAPAPLPDTEFELRAFMAAAPRDFDLRADPVEPPPE